LLHEFITPSTVRHVWCWW